MFWQVGPVLRVFMSYIWKREKMEKFAKKNTKLKKSYKIGKSSFLCANNKLWGDLNKQTNKTNES